jgi:hypothetical protein
MPRKGSHADDSAAPSPPAAKRAGRPATGLSFIVVIALACLATVVVIVWTVHSATSGKREHAGPASFRM